MVSATRMRKIRRAAMAAHAATAVCDRDRLRRFDPLPHQAAFLACTPATVGREGRRKLLRTGNRLGKTTIGAVETVLYALGAHPHDPRPPLPLQWAICSSFNQSLAVQAALWHFAPKDALAPGQRFNPKTGFDANHPVLLFANGAKIEIKTANQKAMNLTSAQVQRVWFDEIPDSPRIYAECVNRTRTAGGLIAATLTPINAPVEWLREEVGAKKLKDLHFPMTPAAMVHTISGHVYVTDDGELCDEEWQNRIRLEVPAHEEPVTIDGEWECRLTDRYFSAFISEPDNEVQHVVTRLPSGLDLDLFLGIDHGTGRGNQIAILVGVEKKAGPGGYCRMWVLDEVWFDEIVTPEQFAKGIDDMLRDWRWQWHDLTRVYGDIDATNEDGSRIGNLDIEDALRRKYGKRDRKELRPRIFSAKRGRGRGNYSKRPGLLWLHRRMVGGDLRVLSRCARLVESLDKWRQEPKSEWMHAIDGLLYAVLFQIRRGPLQPGTNIKLHVR